MNMTYEKKTIKTKGTGTQTEKENERTNQI